MRTNDALRLVVDDPTVAVGELRSFWKRLPQYGEVWIERSDGSSACALLNAGLGWLMYLRSDGDAGFSTRNPRYSGPPDATLEFVLGNGQQDRYPAAWMYPGADVLRALERFALEGAFPPDFAWHNDAGDGTSPPTEESA